jgi:hypothetical protein
MLDGEKLHVSAGVYFVILLSSIYRYVVPVEPLENDHICSSTSQERGRDRESFNLAWSIGKYIVDLSDRICFTVFKWASFSVRKQYHPLRHDTST